MRQFRGLGKISVLCKWAEVSKSSFYYRAREGRRGARACTHTLIEDGIVENALVVEQIRAILWLDYCVYGYQMMTRELRAMGYVINKKKVYRLMKESHLLSGKRITVQGKRKWVRHRRIDAQRPMEYLCLDIKYIWVQGESRWYYQLAVMDVYSRRILCYLFQRSVRQANVVMLMRALHLRYGLKGVIIRNDNGSQFHYSPGSGSPPGIYSCGHSGGKRLYRGLSFYPAAGTHRTVHLCQLLRGKTTYREVHALVQPPAQTWRIVRINPYAEMGAGMGLVDP